MIGLVNKFSDKLNATQSAAPTRNSGLRAAADMMGNLSIPIPDPTAEDRARKKWFTHGQNLARQEAWSDISDHIRHADWTREMTPGGMPVADLIAQGARADAVSAAEHALEEGMPETDQPVLCGIEAMEDVLGEHSDDYAISVIVALTHLEIGLAWRGTGLDAQVAPINREAYRTHMNRAAEILAEQRNATAGSPILLAACCRMLRLRSNSMDDILRAHLRLIALTPENTRILREFGTRLSPSASGAPMLLEQQAKELAAQSGETWGAGVYTWMMVDAICHDPLACAGLDVPFFIDGIKDILARKPDQHVVNFLAAYCALTMGSDTGHDEADFNRACLRDCASWIIRAHMTELHPVIWARAARDFEPSPAVRNSDRLAKRGATEAQRVLKTIFRTTLLCGDDVVFTKDGLVTQAA